MGDTGGTSVGGGTATVTVNGNAKLNIAGKLTSATTGLAISPSLRGQTAP